MNIKPEISVVIPVYKAESILHELIKQLNAALSSLKVSYEIVLVDDRSPDDSWAKMKELSSKHDAVKSYRLSRNFGQHPAIMAGLNQSKGNWIVVMDCDLQDQPHEILKLYNKAQEGFEVVLAKRTARKDVFFKRMSSKLFYKVFNFFAGVDINNEIGNFGIYQRKVIDSLFNLGDALVFFPLFIQWVGFKKTEINVDHASRHDGKSSYNFITLFKLAFNTIISFSDKPLRLFLNLGIVISFGSFIGAIYILYKALNNEIEVMGYSSIFISICFFSGLIISFLGIIGIYLGKTFNQTKHRPIYIIDDSYHK
ncbi:glycosyltransferase family 2 protein [Psychroserpens sp. S379A]|uniref:glycosyltransferase family 2 protein n=1 Tax=Psychroserpens sp. S379A TaxID=3415137 RepID=UPI003C7AEB09